MDVAPVDFYTGIVARLYSPLRGSGPVDPEPYARFVASSGEPALELGCGDGDPLLALRVRGLDVEGVDSSADMLVRLRARASAEGIEVVVHHAAIETMDLGRRYRSIFFAGPTFNLLPDDATAAAALERIAAHLEPDGRVLIPLFEPRPTPPEALGVLREHCEASGALLRVGPVSETRSDVERTQVTMLRYEVVEVDGTVTSEDRPWLLHWYPRDGFTALVRGAGLAVADVLRPDGSPARPTARTVVMVLEPAPSHRAPSV